MGDRLDDQVLLIKVARGGRSLAKDFRPPSSGGEIGDAYSGLIIGEAMGKAMVKLLGK